jgi:hypothetical protein
MGFCIVPGLCKHGEEIMTLHFHSGFWSIEDQIENEVMEAFIPVFDVFVRKPTKPRKRVYLTPAQMGMYCMDCRDWENCEDKYDEETGEERDEACELFEPR